VVFFWGISFVAIKIVVSVIPPITMAVLRFCISWLILWAFSKFTIRNKISLSRKAKWLSILAGLWGITLCFIFENVGVNYTTPAQASILISTMPIFTIVITDFFKRKISSLKLYMMSLVALIGVFVVVLSNGFNIGGDVFGDILILIAAFSWGMYTFYIDKLSGYDNLVTTIEMTKWGVIFLIPFSLVEIILRHGEFVPIKVDVVLWLLFLAALCSGFGYLIWNYVIRTIGPRSAANLIYLVPLISVTSDFLILGNIPSLWFYVGGLILMIGVILGERFSRKEIKENEG
jgi:drug/metabolite transporter (DMT)-like permease